MITTSSAYKTAIRQASRPYDTVYGLITFVDGTTMTVDSSVMPTNAISISSQCIDGDELMFGGVFNNVLKLSLITDKDRYAFYDAKVVLHYKIQTGIENNVPVYEVIDLGVFTVVDADRPHDIVNLTAHDNMSLLDKGIGSNVITGNEWNIFQRIVTETTMQLAFTESDLLNFPNHEYSLSASQENGIATYRDIVKMICQLMGCFAYADRQGRLALKPFSTTPDLALSNSAWYSCVPSDYVTTYIGLSVTGMSGTYSASTTDPSEVGSIMIIEDAPAWDYGSTESLQERTTELFTYLHSIAYTPADLDMPSDASFECGDMLALTLADGVVINTIITSYEWKFHQGMSIESEGINPYFAQEAYVDPTSQRIINQAIAKSKLQFVSFTNENEKVIGDQQTAVVAEVEFTPTANTDGLFVATILVDADVGDITVTNTESVEVPVKAYNAQQQEVVITDLQGNPLTLKGTATNTTTYKRDGKCDVNIFYKLNGIIVPSNEYPYIAVEELENGQHIITLTYPLSDLHAWERYEWQIYMTVNGGIITIPMQSVKASIIGQEVNVATGFTGTIKVEEEIVLIELLGELGVLNITDEGEVTINGATIATASDNVQLYNIDTMELQNIYEGSGQSAPQIRLRGGHFINTETGFRLLTEDGRRLLTE